MAGVSSADWLEVARERNLTTQLSPDDRDAAVETIRELEIGPTPTGVAGITRSARRPALPRRGREGSPREQCYPGHPQSSHSVTVESGDAERSRSRWYRFDRDHSVPPVAGTRVFERLADLTAISAPRN